MCGACLSAPPAVARTFCVWEYSFPIDALIKAYKYEKNLSLTPLFAEALSARVANQPRPDLIMPMPLHKKRLAERGFNQALEIAKPVAAQLALPLVYHACTRIKDTAAQFSLPVKERSTNMKNAFRCDMDLRGAHISVVDDVMTTGASVNALAATLYAQGAGEVSAWVVARTL